LFEKLVSIFCEFCGVMLQENTKVNCVDIFAEGSSFLSIFPFIFPDALGRGLLAFSRLFMIQRISLHLIAILTVLERHLVHGVLHHGESMG
jgi:hypothetical protein